MKGGDVRGTAQLAVIYGRKRGTSRQSSSHLLRAEKAKGIVAGKDYCLVY